MEILKVLWERGPSSVRAVHKRLDPAADLAYNTVQTLMRIMETKGLVEHSLDGRTFIYAACFSRDESAANFLDRVFDGVASQMVMSLLRSERVTPAELERMHAMIGDARRKRRGRAISREDAS